MVERLRARAGMGDYRVLTPAVLILKIDIKAGAVLHSDG